MTDTAVAVPEGRARWTWLAALGLVLAAMGPLLMLIGGVLWGLEISEDVAFFGVTAAIGLVGSFLVLRFGRWSKIVGILASVALAMALFWTAFGIFTPNRFFDVVPGILVIPGALIAIVSCIAAIVADRREHRSSLPVAGERLGMQIVMGLVVFLAVVSGALTFMGRSSVDAAEADLTVSFSDFRFDSESYEIEPGSTVLVRNEDPFLHTFTLEALAIDEALSPGSEVLVEIPDRTGDFVVYCKPHTFDPKNPSEEDMAARLQVK